MSHPLPTEALEPIELPDVEFAMPDGIFIKQMAMPRAGVLVPQHTHTYDHCSMLATGSVRVWKDGVFWKDVVAPLPIFIEAGIAHTFMSLEPAIIYCIHRTDRTGKVDIETEGKLPH